MNRSIRAAICRIDVIRDGETRSRGTGTLVAPGIVLTALHVVADRKTSPPTPHPGLLVLTFPDHKTEARIHDDDLNPKDDWVLLQCEAPPPVPPVPMGRLSQRGVDWETYGLQPPVMELSVSVDTNQVTAVQFGGSPPKDTSLVYARLGAHGNLVTLPRSILDSLQLSFEDLRDTRLLSLQPERVESLEVRGTDAFTVRKQSTNEWVVTPGGLQADASLMKDVLSWLQNLTIVEFSKDFVTDFSAYRLDPPTYSWILRGSSTNANGVVTNGVLAHLDLGGRQGDKVFARRPDESSVYAVRLGDALKLPDAAWKLRDRRVWSFKTNEVTQVTVEKGGLKVQIRRAADGVWSTPAGKLDNYLSIEETVHRIGQLKASVWTTRGESNRVDLGFVEGSHRLTFDVKRGDKAESLTVEFGARAPSLYTYAGVQLEGDWWFFEFPFDLYFMVLRDLSIPKPQQP